MDYIPNDLIHIIFNYIQKISDKRLFTQSCKRINYITKKQMIQSENDFDVEHFNKINKYCMEKFTLELCHDKYFHLIPMSYLNPKNTIIVSALAAFGNIDMLKFAINNGCKFDISGHQYFIMNNSSVTNTCALAALNGHINIMEFCQNNGCPANWLSSLMAATNGHLKVFEYLETLDYIRGFKHNSSVTEIAALNGYCDVLNYLIEHQWNMTWMASRAAAKNGHLNVLQLLKKRMYVFPYYTSLETARYGQITVLKWLHENNCEFKSILMHNVAAEKGYLNITKWLKKNGYEWNQEIYTYAIIGNNLDILKWVIKNDCKWNEETCIAAIRCDNLNALKMLTDYGFQWTKRTIYFVMLYNNDEIINWMKETLKEVIINLGIDDINNVIYDHYL